MIRCSGLYFRSCQTIAVEIMIIYVTQSSYSIRSWLNTTSSEDLKILRFW